MSNIILGPWAKGVPDGVRAMQDEQVRTLYLQEMVGELSGNLFDDIAELGFDIDNSDEQDYSKDLALIVEAIRSYIMKQERAYHPMQDVAVKMFDYNDDGKLFTHPKLDLTFKATIDPE